MKKSNFFTRTTTYGGIVVIYALLSLPFFRFRFPDGFSELRLTGLLPAAAGLLYGFPGALCCALGNLLGDIAGGLDAYWAVGFFGNFLAGWIPYKLWHVLFTGKGQEVRYLDSAGSVLKFALVSFVGACIYAGVIGAGGQLSGGFSFGQFFLPVALQYYSLSILGGMLIFHICTFVFHIVPHIPCEAYEYKKRLAALDYIVCAVLVITVGVLLAVTGKGGTENTYGPEVLSVMFWLLSVVLAVVPFKRTSKKMDGKARYCKVTGLAAQFITIFLLTLCCFFIFITTLCFRLLYVDFKDSGLSADKMSVLWLRLIISGAVAATVFIVVLSLILRVMQKKVVGPLGAAADYAGAFADGQNLKEEELCLETTGNELDDLGASINTMAGDIRRYVEDIRLKTEREGRMSAQLEIARTIQLGMLPDGFAGTGFGIVPYICPAREVGGDFYFFHQLNEDRVLVGIADVSGKDVSAAMFMARTKTLVDAYAGMPPGQMLMSMNEVLLNGNDAMMFVTLFAAVIDRETHIMTYANGGHNAPVYYNCGHTIWLDDEADLVIGVSGEMEYREHVLPIAEDFRLFIYTDGVNEAQNEKGEFFGDERIMKTARQAFEEQVSDEELIRRMEQTLGEFVKGAEQSDDITMVAVSLG